MQTKINARKVLVLLLALVAIFAFAAFSTLTVSKAYADDVDPIEQGDGQEEEHTHNYEFVSFDWSEFEEFGVVNAIYSCHHEDCDGADMEYEATVSDPVTTPATCTTDGSVVYTASYDGHREDHTIVLKAGHNYQLVEFVWSEDNTAKAVCHCANENCPEPEAEFDATMTSETIEAAGCEEEGLARYTATYAGQSESKEVAIPATGHNWNSHMWLWTKTETGYNATASFMCGNDHTHVQNVEATVTDTTVAATCTTAGKTTYVANVNFNGKDYSETNEFIIDAFGHEWGEPSWTWGIQDDGTVLGTATFICANDETHVESASATATSQTTPATCTEKGKTVYTVTVTFYEKKYTATTEVEINPTDHDWSEPSWTWETQEDESILATATFICANDNTHVETRTATAQVVTTPATCTEKGKYVYTATVTFEEKEYTGTNEVTIDALGHDWTNEFTWTATEMGYTASVKFTCANDEEHVQTVDAVVTSETTDAVCADAGKIVYTATVTFEEKEYTDTKEVTVNALGHKWKESEWVWNEAHTEATLKLVCENDEQHVQEVAATVTMQPAGCGFDGYYEATATYEEVTYNYARKTIEGHEQKLTKTDAKAATCTTAGNIAYYTCSECGKHYADAAGKTEIELSFTVVAALGHKLTFHAATATDCETKGNVAYYFCSTCDKYFKDEEATEEMTEAETQIEALGHQWTKVDWDWAEDYSSVTVTVTCARNEEHTRSFTTTIANYKSAAACAETNTYVYTNGLSQYDGVSFDLTVKVDVTAVSCEVTGLAVFTATLTVDGTEYTDVKTVTAPALTHDWGEWKTTKKSTWEGTGIQTRTCNNDPEHTEEREIPAKGCEGAIGTGAAALGFIATALAGLFVARKKKQD